MQSLVRSACACTCASTSSFLRLESRSARQLSSSVQNRFIAPSRPVFLLGQTTSPPVPGLSSSADATTTLSPPAPPLPWFVDPSTLPPSARPAPKLAEALQPLPPPPHLPESLHPLHAHLSVSPFLDRGAITFIHAREKDPDNAWVDWVVVVTLKRGREGGIRGAIEGVRSFLAKQPIDLSPAPAPSPFSPPSHRPLITGLPTPPSSHARARARAPSPSRAEQASGWAMLDAGGVVVHVMTQDARENWGVEELWEGIGRESRRNKRVESGEEEEVWVPGEKV